MTTLNGDNMVGIVRCLMAGRPVAESQIVEVQNFLRNDLDRITDLAKEIGISRAELVVTVGVEICGKKPDPPAERLDRHDRRVCSWLVSK